MRVHKCSKKTNDFLVHQRRAAAGKCERLWRRGCNLHH